VVIINPAIPPNAAYVINTSPAPSVHLGTVKIIYLPDFTLSNAIVEELDIIEEVHIICAAVSAEDTK
jgi:hypothetical protein